MELDHLNKLSMVGTKFDENWPNGYRREIVLQYHNFKHVYSTEAGEDNHGSIKFWL